MCFSIYTDEGYSFFIISLSHSSFLWYYFAFLLIMVINQSKHVDIVQCVAGESEVHNAHGMSCAWTIVSNGLGLSLKYDPIVYVNLLGLLAFVVWGLFLKQTRCFDIVSREWNVTVGIWKQWCLNAVKDGSLLKSVSRLLSLRCESILGTNSAWPWHWNVWKAQEVCDILCCWWIHFLLYLFLCP